MLPWKMLTLVESTGSTNSFWDASDETDPGGFAMQVTVFARYEFSQSFYDIDSPKYPLYMDIKHDYLRRTSKCCKRLLWHASATEPYAVAYDIDVKLDSTTRKPKPFPESWFKYGIPGEPSTVMKHNFPPRPDKGVFYTERKVQYSDTDSNHHANYAFYVKACYDSLFENIARGNFPDTTNTFIDAGVKSFEVTYKQEAFLGDVLTVASWVDSINSNVYYFELLVNSCTCTLVTFEFFLRPRDDSLPTSRI